MKIEEKIYKKLLFNEIQKIYINISYGGGLLEFSFKKDILCIIDNTSGGIDHFSCSEEGYSWWDTFHDEDYLKMHPSNHSPKQIKLYNLCKEYVKY